MLDGVLMPKEAIRRIRVIRAKVWKYQPLSGFIGPMR